jgi:hypothetical protein
VYVETEIKNVELLEKRLEELEATFSVEGVAKAVEDYLTANPPQAGASDEERAQIAKNTEDITALQDQAAGFALKSDIPNLSKYYTATQTDIAIANALKTVKVPTAVSQLTNDANFVDRYEVKEIVASELGVIENGTY